MLRTLHPTLHGAGQLPFRHVSEEPDARVDVAGLAVLAAEARLHPSAECRRGEDLPLGEPSLERRGAIGAVGGCRADDQAVADDALGIHELPERVGLGPVRLGRRTNRVWWLETAVLPGEGTTDRPRQDAWEFAP